MLQPPKLILLSLLSISALCTTHFALAGEGHDAGYEWAEENDIDDTSDCDTPSNSFNEGCEEYVDENDSSEEDEDEDEDDQ